MAEFLPKTLDDTIQLAAEIAFEEGFEAALDFVFTDESDRQVSEEEKALLRMRRSTIIKLVRKNRPDGEAHSLRGRTQKGDAHRRAEGIAGARARA